jgi:hypothetical protein
MHLSALDRPPPLPWKQYNTESDADADDRESSDAQSQTEEEHSSDGSIGSRLPSREKPKRKSSVINEVRSEPRDNAALDDLLAELEASDEGDANIGADLTGLQGATSERTNKARRQWKERTKDLEQPIANLGILYLACCVMRTPISCMDLIRCVAFLLETFCTLLLK